ncbi:MAG TPA: hypothetical protein VF338_01155, partial [Leptolinea sp.]
MMEKKNTQNFREQHKRDVIWQIWLPVAFGAIAIFTLGILAAFSLQSGTDASVRWGQVATIWLMLPVFIVGLLIFILIIGVIVAVMKVTEILPRYTSILQMYARNITTKILSVADKSVQPLVQVSTIKAASQRFWVILRLLILG